VRSVVVWAERKKERSVMALVVVVVVKVVKVEGECWLGLEPGLGWA
jgi:hypothetical protein